MQKNCDDYNELLHRATIDLITRNWRKWSYWLLMSQGTPFDKGKTFVVKLTERTRQDNKMFFLKKKEVPHYAIDGNKNICKPRKS